MLSNTPLLPNSTTHTTTGASTSGMTHFIGAVEDEWQLFSDRASDYTIGEPIGFGASSIVYSAQYHPPSDASRKSTSVVPCALKVLDLDSLPPRSLQLLQRETTLMSLSKHPNVLRVRGSWMDGHKLHIALRLMNKGSAADVMRYGWPGGMEEDVVRCILRQALKGLNYLHINGFIHRDVKAANLLIDDDGTVLLGDLGVAADLAEDTSHHTSSSHLRYSITAKAAVSEQEPLPSSSDKHSSKVAFEPILSRPKIGKRKSFVGTPCWMAPELIEGRQYDSSADIWSFGITALELTQGRPPKSRESPQRVLLKTLQEDPPTLDREGGAYKYTRAFKEVVDSCLLKDPSKRPTAKELLQTPFFRSAKKKSYLVGAILKDLPPLTKRQERRAVNQIHFPHSIDSWDFMTTVNSPATSTYRRRVLEEFVAAEDGDGQYQETDDEQDSRRESRSVSWDSEPEEARGQDQQLEAVTIVSSSPSTSDSGLSDSHTTPSSASSTAASFAESLVVPPKPQERNDSPASAADATVVSEILREGESIKKTASVDTVSQIPDGKGPKVARQSSSSGQLWRKLKGKHLSSSSASGNGVRKERSGIGIGRVFLSSNKNKSSTSTDQTVTGK